MKHVFIYKFGIGILLAVPEMGNGLRLMLEYQLGFNPSAKLETISQQSFDDEPYFLFDFDIEPEYKQQFLDGILEYINDNLPE